MSSPPTSSSNVQSSSSSAPTAAVGVSVADDARRKQLIDDWYHLYDNFQDFQKQDPTKHPLFQIAVNNLQKNQSLDYHRGVYDTLVRIMRLFPVAKEAEREQMISQGLQPPAADAPPQMWEVTITDVMRIQIGYTIGAMLKKWPSDAVPSVENVSATMSRRAPPSGNRALAVASGPATDVNDDDMFDDDSADDAPQ